MKSRLVPRIVSLGKRRNFARSKSLAIEVNTPSQLREKWFFGFARDLYVINLGDYARFRHPLRELAIIGQNQQSFGSEVQATNGIDTLFNVVHILHDRGAILRITRGGHHISGLVEQNVDEVGRRLNALA